MLDTLLTTRMTDPADAIPVDFTGSTISLFLDCAVTLAAIQYSQHSVVQLNRLLRIVKHLDCDRLLPVIEQEYNRACVLDPLDWVIAATENDSFEEVTSAFAQCALNPEPIARAVILDAVRQARTTWRHALLQCLVKDTPNFQDLTVLKVSWPNAAGLAALFEEVKKEREDRVREATAGL